MSVVAMRNAGRYLGAWGAIALCVVLLSLLFTFLGTITCAVLVGMMMGALKGAKWFSVSVSVVIFSMARGARVELTMQQVLLLAALCFGVFWVTYLVSAVLFFCEQKERRSARPPAARPEPWTSAQDTPVAATDCSPAAGPVGATVPARESCLEQLQGNWVREASGTGGPVYMKVIRISETRLELK